MAAFGSGLYRGSGSVDIVGRSKIWYAVLGTVFLICLASMVFRGFNLGIDFEGGTRIQLPAAGANGTITSEQAERVFAETLGADPVSTQTVGTGDAASILLRAETLDTAQTVEVRGALFDELQPLGRDGEPSEQAVSDSAVSATWGGEITQQALIALLVFLGLVTLFLALYFEPRMAVAALVALLHDVVITAGIYSIIGFEVTPASVIGLLTILGFSLYDTVVVFDKVQENTRGLLGLTRRTYAEAANLAVNQTLIRSINTSLIAVLPVLGLLVVGVGLLGVGTLKDLALVQMVGLTSGVVSSLFLASPLLVDLKMRTPAYRQQAERVRQRRMNLARKASGATSAGEDADGAPTGGDRLERDLAPVGGSGPRLSKPAPGARTTSSRAQRTGAKPAGKASRPTGKKRR